MPRLTNHVYLQQCHQFREAWQSNGTALYMLMPAEQWDLFAFFLPHENFTDEQRLVARAQVSALDTSLPQRAGRAWVHHEHQRRLLEEYRARVASEPQVKPKRSGPVKVVARGEVNPYFKPEDMAKIIMRAAMEQVRKDREERDRAVGTDGPSAR